MDLRWSLAADRSAPIWCWPTTPTPTASRWPCATRRRMVAGAARRRDRDRCSADHLLTPRWSRRPTDVVATTVVSSWLLSRSPRPRASSYVETLTGFKWMARAAADGRSAAVRLRGGARLLRGRAWCATRTGSRAALVMAEAAAYLAQTGRTMPERLDDLAAEVGVHETAQVVGPRRGRRSEWPTWPPRSTPLRADPPTQLAGRAVHVDGGSGARRRLPPSDVPGARRSRARRVVLRPSGTEPKLKCYARSGRAAGARGGRGRATAPVPG